MPWVKILDDEHVCTKWHVPPASKAIKGASSGSIYKCDWKPCQRLWILSYGPDGARWEEVK